MILLPLNSYSNDFFFISSESLKSVVEFRTHWRFIPNDDLKYNSGITSDEKWYSDDPSHWWKDDVPEASSYEGIAWYVLQFKIEIPNDIKKIGMAIPFSYSGYQLYLNGTLLYESGSFEKGIKLFGNKPIILELPTEDFNNNINNLCIRVSSINTVGGFLGNGLEKPYFKMGPYDEIISQWARYLFLFSGISSICFFLFLFFLFRFILNKREKYNFHFSLLSLAVGSFLLGYNGFLLYIFNKSWAYWLITFIGGINMYLLPILFINSFFGFKKGIISKLFIWFYLILNSIVIVEFFATGEIRFFMRYLYNFFNLSYILVVIYLFLLGIKGIKRKLEYANIMFIGIVLLGLSFLYSMLTFSGIIHHVPLIGEGFFAMIVVFSFVLAKRFAKTHSDLELTHNNLVFANNEIKELNESLEIKVENRTQELKEKNREITESIEYAGLIQHTMLPTSEDLNEVFAEHFTIWQPKNIVGGDLYWLYKLEDGFLFAALDCTGHGVPGALLSMSAASSLDHIVRQMGLRNPAEILKNLNNIMKNQLNQGDSSAYTDDGLEISLIRYTTGRKTLEFAGSRLRLLVLEDGTFTEFQGSRKGIGFKRTDVDQEFDLHQIDIKPNTTYFLATDGYIEQSGGPDSYMLGWKKYKSILAEAKEDLAVVKEKLMNQFDQYRGDREQMDDVLVVGFRLDMVE